MGDWYDDFEIGGVLEGIIDVVEGISDAANGRTSTYSQRNWIDEEEHEKNLIRNGGWRCRCGNINASYVGTCKCGGTKQDDAFAYDAEMKEQYRVANAKRQAAQRPAPPSGWMCECGKRNAGYQAFCSCGGAQSDGIPYAEYLETSPIRMRPIEPANRTPVQTPPVAKPVEARTAAPVRTEEPKPAEPVIPIVEEEPLIPIMETAEEPLIPIAEAAEEPLIPIMETEEMLSEEEPFIPIVEEKAEPLIPIAQEQEEPLIPLIEEQDESPISIAKPEEKSVFTRPKEESRAPITEKPEEKEREDIFGLKPKPTGNKRFANPFRVTEEKEWKCIRCGAIRPSFMAICECGMSKRDNFD